MTVSEFWLSLELVFGSALGRSLVNDLVLPEIGLTAVQALDVGIEPFTIWAALIEETNSDSDALWVHRKL